MCARKSTCARVPIFGMGGPLEEDKNLGLYVLLGLNCPCHSAHFGMKLGINSLML